MMKRVLSVAMAVAVVAALSGPAFAQMRGSWGGGYGYMMGGPGPGAAPGWCPMFPAQTEAAAVTEDRAKELAQAYADQYLKGFTVDRVLPFNGRRGTMYSVELKGPAGEVRTFHVNPWGNVMPFGGPARRG